MKLLRVITGIMASARAKRILQFAALLATLSPLLSTDHSRAAFSRKVKRSVVEIDGVRFGAFEPINDLSNLTELSKAGMMQERHRVVLQRDFVTDPSLYAWASGFSSGQPNLKDIHIISENGEGQEVSRHVLKLSQPISWAVEASNPSVGGFHEKVEFSVQEIELL